MKVPFTKAFKGDKFNEQEASALLCSVEAQVNSRPIAKMSTSSDDLSTLHITPGHLLVDEEIQHLSSHFKNATCSAAAVQQSLRRR